MSRRAYLRARTRYLCEWKCAHCGRMNRERGEIASSDRVRVGTFTDNLPDEVQLSGEIAQDRSRKRFFLLQQRVNEECWLQGLRVSGVCRKCGMRQMWAPAVRQAWAAVMAVVCLALLTATLGMPESGDVWLAYLAAAAGTSVLTTWAGLRLVRWRLRRRTDTECTPWLEEIPRDE